MSERYVVTVEVTVDANDREEAMNEVEAAAVATWGTKANVMGAEEL